jgi:HEAT repeat protein
MSCERSSGIWRREIHAPYPKLIETIREQIASKKDDVRETAARVLRELGNRPGG